MSATPSAPPPSTSEPKKITILTPGSKATPANPAGQPKGLAAILANKKKIIKIMEISLTLFYGQFIANAVFDNFVRGLPDLIDTGAAFPIVKVVLGVIILAASVFALVVIWLKLWHLIFASACILIAISVTSLVVVIIDLVLRKERKELADKEFNALIAEISIESFFRIGAVIVKFFMVKLIKLDYHRVPTSA